MKKLIPVIIIILVATLSACKSSISDDFLSNNISLTESESSNQKYNQFDSVSSENTQSDDDMGKGNKLNETNNSTVSQTAHNAVSSFVSSEDKSNEDTKTFEQYEEFNKKYPVQGEKEWIFRSTDKDYIAPYDSSELSECCIYIDESDHVTITWNYYYNLKNHPEFSNSDSKKIKYDNKDYCWFLCYKYEGTCFVEQNGYLTIKLKCTNDLGEYVNDRIEFKREGADKLVVISHSGTEFNLFKGDEFNR